MRYYYYVYEGVKKNIGGSTTTITKGNGTTRSNPFIDPFLLSDLICKNDGYDSCVVLNFIEIKRKHFEHLRKIQEAEGKPIVHFGEVKKK